MRDMEIGVVMIVIVALMVCCFSLLTNVVGRGAEVYQCQGFARVLNTPGRRLIAALHEWPPQLSNTQGLSC
jgi:hypothetical protein